MYTCVYNFRITRHRPGTLIMARGCELIGPLISRGATYLRRRRGIHVADRSIHR